MARIEINLYEVYCKSYGKVMSGATLTDRDYYWDVPGGAMPLEEKGKAAVSLAAQDVKTGGPMRTKPEFEEQILRLIP